MHYFYRDTSHVYRGKTAGILFALQSRYPPRRNGNATELEPRHFNPPDGPPVILRIQSATVSGRGRVGEQIRPHFRPRPFRAGQPRRYGRSILRARRCFTTPFKNTWPHVNACQQYPSPVPSVAVLAGPPSWSSAVDTRAGFAYESATRAD